LDNPNSTVAGAIRQDAITVRPFAEHGHYTEVHDAVFDVIMKRCPPNAFKVLCLILRKTRGWRKDSDSISYTQIRNGTGIASDTTVHTALKWLHDQGMILRHDEGRASTEAMGYSIDRSYNFEARATRTVSQSATRTVPQPATGIVDTITNKQYPSNNATTVAAEISADRWIKTLVDRCEEVGFHPTPKQKLTWGNELNSKRRQGQDTAQIYALITKITAAAADGYFHSFKRAEEGPPGKASRNGHHQEDERPKKRLV
jgi:hypothetical protein